MSYFPPQEIKAEVKINKLLYVKDAMFIGAYMSVAFIFEKIVYGPYIVLYYVFSLCVAIYLCAPSISNPKRRNWQSFLIFIDKVKDAQFFRQTVIKEHPHEKEK